MATTDLNRETCPPDVRSLYPVASEERPKTFTYVWYDYDIPHKRHVTILPEDGYAIDRVGTWYKVYDRATTKMVGLHLNMWEAEAQVVELNGSPDLLYLEKFGFPTWPLWDEGKYTVYLAMMHGGAGFPLTKEGMDAAIAASGILKMEADLPYKAELIYGGVFLECHNRPGTYHSFVILISLDSEYGRSWYTSYPCVKSKKCHYGPLEKGGQLRWF